MYKKIILSGMLSITCSLYSISAMAAECSQHSPFGYPVETNQILCKEGFVVGYNYKTKNPDWVAYHITKESVSKYRKRINRFSEDKSIPTSSRASLKDYKRSGYDRGHLAPNATMDFSENAQKESFLLSNMVPQLPKHNRNGWKILEKYVREWTKERGELYVVSGVLYDEDRTFIGNNVEIPDYFYKVILDPITSQTTAFLIPHQAFGKSDIPTFVVSIDELESATGMDFFNELEDSIEFTLEDQRTYWGNR